MICECCSSSWRILSLMVGSSFCCAPSGTNGTSTEVRARTLIMTRLNMTDLLRVDAILPEPDVERGRDRQHDDGQHGRPGVPRAGAVAGHRRQPAHEADEI